MKAVILVGGEGSRLRPLTDSLPKPLVPLLNQPFLAHTLSRLQEYDVNHVILALHYLPKRFHELLQNEHAANLEITLEVESIPLGTAGAVKNAAVHLDDEPFVVLNGDIFTDLDLRKMVSFHHRNRADATLFLTPVDNPSAYGVVETDKEARVLRFLEKPSLKASSSRWVNGGVYILNPRVLEFVPPKQFYTFEHGLFPELLRSGYRVFGYHAQTYWIDVGTPEAYLKLHHDLLLGHARPVQLIDTLMQDAQQGTGYYVHPEAQVNGPVLIGKGCHISKNAKVVGPSVLGPKSVIEEEAQIEGSVLWRNVTIGSGVSIRNCVIANGAVIGKGMALPPARVVGSVGSIMGRPPSNLSQ